MTGKFSTPDERQAALCRQSGVAPEGMAVILENESVLALKHHKSGNEISIHKGEKQRRIEQNGY